MEKEKVKHRKRNHGEMGIKNHFLETFWTIWVWVVQYWGDGFFHQTWIKHGVIYDGMLLVNELLHAIYRTM